MIASQTEADRKARNAKGWREKPFLWPEQKNALMRYIDVEQHGKHVWFTPLLYDKPHRGKDDVTTADIVWADLEECHPDSVTPSAPIVIESSPGRYQAIWKLDTTAPISALLASEYSGRIAHQYKHMGADTSGSDLAQLLRVPGTFNYKAEYVLPSGEPPAVAVVTLKSLGVPAAIFDALPAVENAEATWEELPEQLDADEVTEKYSRKLTKTWHELYTMPPESDWSKVLWRFLQSCFEAGMSKQEVWSVGIEAACNKFKRDGYKPNLQLWGDVLRAHAKYEQLQSRLDRFDRPAIDLPALYDATELDGYGSSFVDRYFEWASGLSDAPPQYHQLCGFVVLSAVLSGNIHIESSIGDIVPNIWAMILADTTMTRKTTAMDHATDLIESVPGCENIILATDGSMEGIFKAMSQRPGMPSVFKKDEVQGFMAGVGKKDYMAGMLEGLAKLYDGKNLKRQLTKESITVHRPVFLMLSAGIKTKMFSLLSAEHVESGFLPRFLFVTGEGEVANIKPLGPRTDEAKKVENKLRTELAVLRGLYCDAKPYTIAGGQAAMATPMVTAELTQAAWERCASLERALMQAGADSVEPDMYVPMLARFYMSTLKCACLLAADRQEPHEEHITVGHLDIIKAVSYTSTWMPSMLELVSNLGKSAFESDTMKVLKFIAANDGCPSGSVMRYFRLSAREMGNIMDTLEGRGLVDIRRDGKAKLLWSVGL